MDKSKVCFIRAGLRNDYVIEGIKKSGYKVLRPYIGKTLITRAIREVVYKLNLPLKKCLYNKKILKENTEVFIISEMQIKNDFLQWLKRKNPTSRVILKYENRVNINNINIGKGLNVERWSYDEDDCKKYNMNLLPPCYLDIYKIKKEIPKYDIIYLGADKGRGEKILDLEKKFNSLGLNTYFRICADRVYQRYKKKYYKKTISYLEYTKLISKSKAILNIMPENQKSLTMRDFEVVFNGIKGITNRKAIKDFELYDPSRFFILGEENFNSLPEFLNSSFLEINESEIEKYKFDRMVEKICNF